MHFFKDLFFFLVKRMSITHQISAWMVLELRRLWPKVRIDKLGIDRLMAGDLREGPRKKENAQHGFMILKASLTVKLEAM